MQACAIPLLDGDYGFVSRVWNEYVKIGLSSTSMRAVFITVL